MGGGGAVLLSGLLKSNGYTTGALSSLVREREASYELQVSAVTADDFFFFHPRTPCLASHSVKQVLLVGSVSNLHT